MPAGDKHENISQFAYDIQITNPSYKCVAFECYVGPTPR